MDSRFYEYTRYFQNLFRSCADSDYDRYDHYYKDYGFKLITTGEMGSSPDENIILRAERNIPENLTGTYIDAGCGRGYFLKYLADKNPQASFIGVNSSKVQLDDASAINSGPNIRYKLSSFDDLSWVDPDSIDGIYFIESLGYCELLNTITQIRRVLKRNGWVSIQDICQCDDLDAVRYVQLAKTQKSWGYAFYPVWYLEQAFELGGFSMINKSENSNHLVNYSRWDKVCSAGLQDEIGDSFAPFKTSELLLRKSAA